jgi:hypothetical protein
MKKILFIIALFLTSAVVVNAAPVSWDFTSSILRPLQSAWNSEVRVPWLTATSTTATNTLPILSSNTICLSGDTCRTTWPTGGGSGSVSTSTVPVAGQLAFWTSPSALSSVATGTLTEAVTGLQLDATRALVGGSAILSLTSGYEVPLTASTSQWQTAFGWGNHASAGYLSTVATTTVRGMFSATSPATYDSGTGAIGVSVTGDWTGTLDGIEGASFLRSDTSDSYTSGTLTFDAATSLDLNTTGISIADTDIAFDGASTNLNTTGNLTVNTDSLVVNKSSGNVGLGTTSPLATITQRRTLAIQDTTYGAVLRLFGTADFEIIGGTASAYVGTRTNHPIMFATNNATRFTIASSGNIGVGTTNPNAFFTINGDLQLAGSFTDTASSTGSLGMFLQSTGTSTRWTATSTLGIPSSASTTNWNTFYDTPSSRITAGTGIDWSGNTLNGVYTAGDALTLTGEDFDFDGGATPAGDLGGTWATPTVDDDSHAHTGTTISGLDISDDTNLTAGDALTLTGDDIDFDGGATPAGELGGTWASPTIDDSLSVTSWNLTSPTLTSFFGTPCTGNEFLQDISDTGAFTCVAASGGGGGGALSTTTDTIGSGGSQLVSYVTGDVMFGGSASTSAEFQFDDDGGQFIISSTSAQASTTLMNTNSTETIVLGVGSSSNAVVTNGLSFDWKTAASVVIRGIGSVTTFVLRDIWNFLAATVYLPNHTMVATSTYYGATTSDAMVVAGYMNTGEWMEEFCTSPTQEVTQVVADVLSACGNYNYLEDANGFLDFVAPTTGTSSYFRFRPGTAAIAAAGEGMGIGWASGIDFGAMERHTPAMEWTMRQDALANASATIVMAGLTDKISVSADYATEPAQGFYVIASTTNTNYQFACNPSTGGTTYIDTGVASSTTAVSASNPFTHWRLELSGTSATAITAILKVRTVDNQNFHQVGACSLNLSASTQLVAPGAGIGKVSNGLQPELHIGWMKFWYNNPTF